MIVKLDRKKLALVVGLSALLTAPAGAISPGKDGSKKSAQDPSRRVCRSLTETGTRFSTRVCKTQAEWDEQMRKTQDSALDHQWKNSAASENRGPG